MKLTPMVELWSFGPWRARRMDYRRGSVYEVLFDLGRLWGYFDFGRRHFRLSAGVKAR